jgi:hypothetical protein
MKAKDVEGCCGLSRQYLASTSRFTGLVPKSINPNLASPCWPETIKIVGVKIDLLFSRKSQI